MLSASLNKTISFIHSFIPNCCILLHVGASNKDALNTFYLRLYGVRHMVKDHSDSERGNPLPPHGLLFPITPVVEHWLEREIAASNKCCTLKTRAAVSQPLCHVHLPVLVQRMSIMQMTQQDNSTYITFEVNYDITAVTKQQIY